MLFLSNPEMLMQAARENRNEIYQISRIKWKITQQYNAQFLKNNFLCVFFYRVTVTPVYHYVIISYDGMTS